MVLSITFRFREHTIGTELHTHLHGRIAVAHLSQG